MFRLTLSLRRACVLGLRGRDSMSGSCPSSSCSYGPLWYSCPYPPTLGLKAFLLFPSCSCKTVFFCLNYPHRLDFYSMGKQDPGGLLCPSHSRFLGIPVSPLASDGMHDKRPSRMVNPFPPLLSASPRGCTPSFQPALGLHQFIDCCSRILLTRGSSRM